MGIVEGSCEYRARGVSIQGKFVLSRNMVYKTRDRHVAKYSSDPRQAYHEVKVQGRDLVRVVAIVAPFAPKRVRYTGKIRFIEPRGGGANRPRRRVSGASRSGSPRESQANFRVGTGWGL